MTRRAGASATAEAFADGAFTPAGRLSVARAYHVSVALPDGRILITGGQQSRGQILRSAEIFDPASGEFISAGDMIFARHKHAAALLPDGRVLILGGATSTTTTDDLTKTTEIFDPATGRFAAGPEMAESRYKFADAVAVLPSGDIMVAGGGTIPEIFRAESQEFVSLRGSPGGGCQFQTSSVLRDGRVLVVGGYSDRIRPTAGAWIIDHVE